VIQKTLVTSPRVTPDAIALMQAAKTSGQPTIQLQTFRPTDELQGMPIAVYGESLFAIILTSKLNHVVLEPTSDWLCRLPHQYSQRTVIKTTIGEARRYDQPCFVKNADGMKAFEAQVYDTGKDLPSTDYYPDDYEVLVSEPVNWEIEYRCFIRERKLITLSVYFRHGELAKSPDGVWLEDMDETAEASHFCQTLLQDDTVAMPPACVIDIGRITGRGWAVIEANPAYGSGIYGCDPLKVLDVVNRATIQSSNITQMDAPWITAYEVED
jgi:hypothetical protein